MQSIFEHSITPLASLLRPEKLDDLVGQSHLIGENKAIRKFIEAGRLPSILLWWPPGCGKTSLARVIANSLDAEFFHLSGVLSKKEDVIKIISKAQSNFKAGRQTILFLDEIHRWTKSQQDVLLPWVEKWIVTLIGATTENPSFTVINALLSRCRTYILNPITPEEVVIFIEKNIDRIQERYPKIVFHKKDESSEVGVRGEGIVWAVTERSILTSEANSERVWLPLETFDTFGHKSIEEVISKKENIFSLIAKLWNGDLRNTLWLLETACILQGEWVLTREIILESGSKSLSYDQNGEEHYNLISAMHKSLRDSDGDAAIYWIGRMLTGGEDPRYIARRMMNFASEDIYDPQAIILTNSVYDICEKMGMPECELPILNVAYYLADTPKDNRIYMAQSAMHRDIHEFWNLWVPLHLRNAPTGLMKEVGYWAGYEYAHNLENKKSTQEHFPEELKGRKYRK
jgi:putative ATPase